MYNYTEFGRCCANCKYALNIAEEGECYRSCVLNAGTHSGYVKAVGICDRYEMSDRMYEEMPGKEYDVYFYYFAQKDYQKHRVTVKARDVKDARAIVIYEASKRIKKSIRGVRVVKHGSKADLSWFKRGMKEGYPEYEDEEVK